MKIKALCIQDFYSSISRHTLLCAEGTVYDCCVSTMHEGYIWKVESEMGGWYITEDKFDEHFVIAESEEIKGFKIEDSEILI